MSTENPYQPPQSESQPNPATFTQYPTWKFWALILLSPPGIVTLLIESRYSSDPSLNDGFGRNFGYFWLLGLIFCVWAVRAKWPTIGTHQKSAQKFTCVVAITGLTFVSALCMGHFTASMTFLMLFGNAMMRFVSPQARLLLVGFGAFAALFPLSLGIALAYDAMGRPLKRRFGKRAIDANQ
jgi:hypothetical protein